MKIGIFTKPIHVEKIVNYLNQHTNINYVISTSKQEVYAYDYDIGISYCFPYIVKIDKIPWYNYHPAPLPKYPGLMNYTQPIYDKVKDFGVTLHEMTNEVDGGLIIKVRKFKLSSLPTSTNELGTISHYHLFQLFKETVELICNRRI